MTGRPARVPSPRWSGRLMVLSLSDSKWPFFLLSLKKSTRWAGWRLCGVCRLLPPLARVTPALGGCNRCWHVRGRGAGAVSGFEPGDPWREGEKPLPRPRAWGDLIAAQTRPGELPVVCGPFSIKPLSWDWPTITRVARTPGGRPTAPPRRACRRPRSSLWPAAPPSVTEGSAQPQPLGPGRPDSARRSGSLMQPRGCYHGGFSAFLFPPIFLNFLPNYTF